MSSNELLLATTNPGKLREIKAYLSDIFLCIFSLSNLKIEDIFPENGKTFKENALRKSLFYSKKWDGLTLAEDSGIEIDALNAKPGVRSARFSGPRATDESNIKKVLNLMKGISPENRKARFVSCMVLAQKGKIIKEIQEYVEGFIMSEPTGKLGFGYDPIFYYPPFKKTFAEVLPSEKNKASHRGRALKRLKIFLRKYLQNKKY